MFVPASKLNSCEFSYRQKPLPRSPDEWVPATARVRKPITVHRLATGSHASRSDLSREGGAEHNSATQGKEALRHANIDPAHS